MNTEHANPANGAIETEERDRAPNEFDRTPGHNEFDRVASDVVEIERTAARGQLAGRADEIGWCCEIERSPGWKQTVRERFGGGDYVAKGYDSKGIMRRVPFTLPGPSLTIARAEQDEEEDDDIPPPRWPSTPPWGVPAGHAGHAGHFPQGVPGNPGAPPPWVQAMLGRPPVRTEEVERLRRENDNLARDLKDALRDLEREREAKREAVEREKELRIRAEHELDRYKERIESERREAAVQREMAEMRATLTALREGGSGKTDKALIDLLTAKMTAMESQIAEAGKRDVVGDLLKLQKLTGGGGKADLAGQVGEAVRALKALKDIAGDEGGGEDKPTWASLLETLGPAALETLERMAAGRGGAANPAAPGAPPGLPAPQEDPVIQAIQNLNRIAGELVRHAKAGNPPATVLVHVRGIASGISAEFEKQFVERLRVHENAASLRDELTLQQQQLAVLPPPMRPGNVAKLASLLGTPEGEAWFNEFLGELRGS